MVSKWFQAAAATMTFLVLVFGNITIIYHNNEMITDRNELIDKWMWFYLEQNILRTINFMDYRRNTNFNTYTSCLVSG